MRNVFNTRSRGIRHAVAMLAIAVALPCGAAFAQDAEETLDEESSPQAGFVGEVGYAWQGESDIDGGGGASMHVNRFDVGLLGRLNFAERFRWTNSLFYAANDYKFDGGGFSAGNPWGTVNTLRLQTKLRFAIDEQWGISAGGVFTFAPESGADWGDSFTGGGLLAADYRASKDFMVSLGAAVVSQIEDDARVVPSVIMVWTPQDEWAVRVGAVPASGGAAAAAEVAYRIAEPVEIGLGALYNQRRFRLDDGGPAPDGVGEDNNLPVRLRLGWNALPNLSFNALAGVALAGSLQLDDRSGNTLRDENYDPAPYIGLRMIGSL